jgi:hypothetical protein
MTTKTRYEVTVRKTSGRHAIVERYYFEDYWDAQLKMDYLDEIMDSRFFTEFRDLDPFNKKTGVRS